MDKDMKSLIDLKERHEQVFALAVALRDRLESKEDESQDSTSVILANMLVDTLGVMQVVQFRSA